MDGHLSLATILGRKRSEAKIWSVLASSVTLNHLGRKERQPSPFSEASWDDLEKQAASFPPPLCEAASGICCFTKHASDHLA